MLSIMVNIGYYCTDKIYMEVIAYGIDRYIWDCIDTIWLHIT